MKVVIDARWGNVVAEASQNLIGRALNLRRAPAVYQCVYAGKRKRSSLKFFYFVLAMVAATILLVAAMLIDTNYFSRSSLHWTAWLLPVNLVLCGLCWVTVVAAYRRRVSMLTAEPLGRPSRGAKYRAAREAEAGGLFNSLGTLLPVVLLSNRPDTASQPTTFLVVLFCLAMFMCLVFTCGIIVASRQRYSTQVARRAARLAQSPA